MARRGGIRFRAWLYLGAAVTPVVIEKTGAILLQNKWPSPQLWFLSFLCACATGFITLRAYYDGSAQRSEDEEKQTNTAFFKAPTPTP